MTESSAFTTADEQDSLSGRPGLEKIRQEGDCGRLGKIGIGRLGNVGAVEGNYWCGEELERETIGYEDQLKIG